MTAAHRTAGVACIPIRLTREHWSGRAALAWVPAASYAELSSRTETFLGSREAAAYAALEHERRKTSYLLGRYAAKQALMTITELRDPRAIDIEPGCFQQPVVRASTPAGADVSISHGALAACAIAFPQEHPMAVDVEEIEASRADVMRTQFTARELAYVNAGGADVAMLCCVIWTAKEALSKALRCGMTTPFEVLETDQLASQGSEYGGRFRNFSQYRFASWQRDGSVVTLVLPRKTTLEFEMAFP